MALSDSDHFTFYLRSDEVSPLKTHEEDPTMYGEDVDVWCTIKLAAALQNGGNWRAIKGKVTMKNENEYLVRRILQRTKVEGDHESFVYTLEVIKPLTNKNEKIYTVKNVPRSALSFYYKPYRSDAFVENAFRHELMVPDEIFPKAWKNIDM